jgi:hypothetical protein
VSPRVCGHDKSRCKPDVHGKTDRASTSLGARSHGVGDTGAVFTTGNANTVTPSGRFRCEQLVPFSPPAGIGN